MLKAFDLNADLPSLAILHKKASHPGGFFVSGVRVELACPLKGTAASGSQVNPQPRKRADLLSKRSL